MHSLTHPPPLPRNKTDGTRMRRARGVRRNKSWSHGWLGARRHCCCAFLIISLRPPAARRSPNGLTAETRSCSKLQHTRETLFLGAACCCVSPSLLPFLPPPSLPLLPSSLSLSPPLVNVGQTDPDRQLFVAARGAVLKNRRRSSVSTLPTMFNPGVFYMLVSQPRSRGTPQTRVGKLRTDDANRDNI